MPRMARPHGEARARTLPDYVLDHSIGAEWSSVSSGTDGVQSRSNDKYSIEIRIQFCIQDSIQDSVFNQSIYWFVYWIRSWFLFDLIRLAEVGGAGS